MAKITSRWNATQVLFECDGDIRKTVMEAVAKKACLRGADLSGAYLSGADLSEADLRGADLSGAYLSGADLSEADLRGAYLSGADLRGAYLSGADLRGAYLSGADLRGAYLSGACLRGAYLSGAYLSGAKVAWQSHDVIAEILRRAAGGDVEKLKYAGLVLLKRDWCWPDHVRLADPMLPWALAELAKWIQADDGHPDCLNAHVAAIAEAPAAVSVES